MRAFAQRTALIQHMCQRRWDFGMARTLRLGARLVTTNVISIAHACASSLRSPVLWTNLWLRRCGDGSGLESVHGCASLLYAAREMKHGGRVGLGGCGVHTWSATTSLKGYRFYGNPR